MFSDSNTRIFMRGLDLDEHKRRRESERYSLRKKNREEMLQAKRRRFLVDETDTKISPEDYVDLYLELPRLPEYVQALASPDPSCRYKSIVMLRKMVSIDQNPPYEQIISAGCVEPSLFILVNANYPKLQVEAAWFLTNIASGPDVYARAMVQAGGLDALKALASDLEPRANLELAGQCVWAIGNIAGDTGARSRIDCLAPEVFRLIAGLLSIPGEQVGSDPTAHEAAMDASWCLSNLCRWGSIWIPKDSAQTMTHLIQHGLKQYTSFGEIVPNLLWAAANLCNIPMIEDTDEKEQVDPSLVTLQDLLEFGFEKLLPQLVNCLRVDGKYVTAALRIVGNFLVADDEIAVAVCRMGLVSRLKTLLFDSSTKRILKEVIWALHNVMVSQPYPNEVADEKVVDKLIYLARESPSPAVQRESFFCLGYLIEEADWNDIVLLMDKNVWKAVARMLDQENTMDLLELGLISTRRILQAGVTLQNQSGIDENPFIRHLEEEGCLDLLEQVQASDRVNENIFNASVSIVRTFWEFTRPLGPKSGFRPSLADCGKRFQFDTSPSVPMEFSF